MVQNALQGLAYKIAVEIPARSGFFQEAVTGALPHKIATCVLVRLLSQRCQSHNEPQSHTQLLDTADSSADYNQSSHHVTPYSFKWRNLSILTGIVRTEL